MIPVQRAGHLLVSLATLEEGELSRATNKYTNTDDN